MSPLQSCTARMRYYRQGALVQPLPIGTQTFADIRDHDFLYVDKTALIAQLVQPGKGFYFLSRPRRFGKSVLISTQAALFEGRADLFAGLAITAAGYAFPKHPVLQIAPSCPTARPSTWRPGSNTCWTIGAGNTRCTRSRQGPWRPASPACCARWPSEDGWSFWWTNTTNP